ncbi:MAG: response regulator transcription factor [Sneathiella sp.]|nr:response regulator transcription factor [Sneathiella sp.]
MNSTVYIVDDDPGIQEALIWLFSSINQTALSFTNTKDFSDVIDGIETGCILLDVRMPIMSGMEFQQILIEKKISLPIIFITGHGDVPMAVSALKSGAFDFIQKPFNNQQLIDTVLKAIRLSEDTAQAEIKLKEKQSQLSILTNRERDVYQLMVLGHSNKEMARQLDVSTKTIETHRANIIRKLNVRNLSELMQIDRMGEALPVEDNTPTSV